MIVNAITSFLGKLIEEAMQPVRELLADTLLATPDVTKQADVRRMWSSTLGIAVSVYVLLVLAGGVTVMGHETVQTRYALKQIAPRLLLGLIAATASLTVMGKVIGLSNAVVQAVMGTDLSDAGKGLVERILPFALFGAPGLKLYLSILSSVVITLVVAVLVGFIVRVAIMALLAVTAPLALSCHGHPATDPIARLWWRGLAGCMVIQIAQSVTFILALKLFFAPGATLLGIPKPNQLGTLLAGMALFWVLFKIPSWTVQVILRGTPAHNPHAPAALRVLRHLAMYRLMGRYLPGVAGARRGGGRPPSAGGGLRGPGGGGGRGGGSGGGGGRGGPRRPLPGLGAVGGLRGRGRSLLARGRAAAQSRGHRAGPAGSPARRTRGAGVGGHTTTQAATGNQRPSGLRGRIRATALARRSTATLPGASATPTRLGATPTPRTPKGPRAVSPLPRGRRMRQLKLPVAAQKVASRPSRPVQTWLPTSTPRQARSRSALGSPTQATSTKGAANPRRTSAPRARQLTLPVPAQRVRVRPARPMQLRLPLEPPRPPRTPGGSRDD
ncbi:hypothetical protein [Streptomyces sp. NPDC042319]|uniref:hypothetical protein n=1 Tax=Streptomyces sp. NPDC042319 TaxID=3154332 RepID=UPI0033DD9008